MTRRDPKNYVAGPGTTVTNIDLDEEVFMYKGARLTEERAEQLAKEILAKTRAANLVPGRKSLGEDGSHSPVIHFRSPRRAEAEAVARELDISLSELARRAVDAYLDDRAG